ncbi:MAG TPA: helix-turn-helix transcriptional regulator [Cytophagaceae bacterium]|jgi:AraC-like DNA-binding protein|nr:helix-turn-helix transcriptional regulator [Cytophagaceae bacterium]
MKIYIKYNLKVACEKILQEQLDTLDFRYSLLSFGEVEIKDSVSSEKLKQLGNKLNNYGIEIVESHKTILVQKIKNAIIEMVHMDEKLPNSKISSYLADKIGHSYGYISNLFTEITYTSIANFIALQKTERAKQLIITNELTFTEIAWKLNYSSVAHFSNHFKDATGITPTAFQRIMNKRNNISPAENKKK